MKTAWLVTLAAALLGLGLSPAAAQMVVSAKSGVVNYTQGQVNLNGQAVESSLTKYPDVKENGVLRTDAGRVELLLTPGVILRMGENASLKMITNRLVDTRVELESGSAVVEAVETAKDNHVTVVVRNGAAGIAKAGIYRFDAEPARVKVFRGAAEVEMNGETTPVGAGRMMLLDGSSAAVEKFNPEDTDALDHWSRQRGQLLAMANPSAAKSALGGYGSGFYGLGYGGLYGGAFGLGYGSGYGLGCTPYWGYNSWYAMYTYVPCSGYFTSPYGGYGYWSPVTVNQVFRHPDNFGVLRSNPRTPPRLGRYTTSVAPRSVSAAPRAESRSGGAMGTFSRGSVGPGSGGGSSMGGVSSGSGGGMSSGGGARGGGGNTGGGARR